MKVLTNSHVLLRVLFLSLGFNYHVNAVSVVNQGRSSNLRRLDDQDASCMSIVDSVCGNPDWTVYCSYLQQLVTSDPGLAQSLEDDVYTLFVPSDSAWGLVDEGILAGVNTQELNRILSFHMYEQSIFSFDELVCTDGIISKSGDKSRTKCDDDNMVKYQTGNGNRRLDLPPKIISKDLRACNGIIHGVDHVMMPVVLKEFSELVFGSDTPDDTTSDSESVEDAAPTDDSNSTTAVDDSDENNDSINSPSSVLYDCAMDACIHKDCYGTGFFDDGYCGAAWYCDDYATYTMGDGEKEDVSCIRDGCTSDDGIEWDNDIQGWRCSSTPITELDTCDMNACIHKDCFGTGYFDDGYCGAAWYCDDYESYTMGDDEEEDKYCIRDGCTNDDGIEWNNEIQGWACSTAAPIAEPEPCAMNACIHKNCYETGYFDDGDCGAAWYCSDYKTYVMGDGEEQDGYCIRDGCTSDDGIQWNNEISGWSCIN